MKLDVDECEDAADGVSSMPTFKYYAGELPCPPMLDFDAGLDRTIWVARDSSERRLQGFVLCALAFHSYVTRGVTLYGRRQRSRHDDRRGSVQALALCSEMCCRWRQWWWR